MALPPLLCAASRIGTLVHGAKLSARCSSPAPHLCHFGTRASLPAGFNLAPLGYSLALMVRFALSTLSVRSSLCGGTALSRVELLALPILLVSCVTPCLCLFTRPQALRCCLVPLTF